MKDPKLAMRRDPMVRAFWEAPWDLVVQVSPGQSHVSNQSLDAFGHEPTPPG